MSERCKRARPGTIPPVRIRPHPVDWEEGDPSDQEFRWLSALTFRAINVIGQDIQRDCHYINPCVTVSCSEPTTAFFGEVIDRQGSWLREFRATAGKCGQRQLVKLAGLTARQSSLCGFLFIGGRVIPPRDWEAMADRLLHPCDVPPYATTKRHVDLATLKATGDPGPLKPVSLAEIGSHLTANPGSALYVCPGISVVAPTSSRAFLAEARKRSKEWHGKLQHFLGKDKQALAGLADLSTRLLVFHGTLVIDGRAYLPGCWPGGGQKKHDPERTPFKSPTVPLVFLGLDSLS